MMILNNKIRIIISYFIIIISVITTGCSNNEMLIDTSKIFDEDLEKIEIEVIK